MNDRLTVERAKELLDYSPETGLMTWKSSRMGASKGREAGSLEKGYRRASIDRKRYPLHRVAWLIHYGTWPKEQIDHINGNRSDNRISNLREATHDENCENQHQAQSDNRTTGLLGASFDRRRRVFRASIMVKKVVHRLGTFKTAEAAHQAYLEAKRRLHAFNTL